MYRSLPLLSFEKSEIFIKLLPLDYFLSDEWPWMIPSGIQTKLALAPLRRPKSHQADNGVFRGVLHSYVPSEESETVVPLRPLWIVVSLPFFVPFDVSLSKYQPRLA